MSIRQGCSQKVGTVSVLGINGGLALRGPSLWQGQQV